MKHSLHRPLLANLKRVPEIFTCVKETSRWLPLTLVNLGIRPLACPFEVRLRSGGVRVLGEWTDLVIFWLVFRPPPLPRANIG
jgi:hypothetical protein